MFKAAAKPKSPRNAAPKRGRPRKHARGSLTPLLVRLPKPLHAQLRRVAAAEGRSINDIVIDLISRWSDRRRARQP
ncbi:MAG: toxin-antitoxin system HicB family antitoxin [Deltaproteobacteria bacterium]|jgi:predicted HicB family RNase H-like nuclease|nr:toxin-antitoxin system HicB family antitoxin [Deltaproteobacteria bacterium]